jgi:predicted nucleic acid-binding protein
LEYLHTVNVGFADASLAAGAEAENVPIAPFDRDFDKFKQIGRYQPKA